MVTCGSWSECETRLNENGLTVLKISTSWCGPCKLLQKTLEEIEKAVNDVIFIGVDADEVDDYILEKFDVRGVPVLIVLDKDGNVLSKTVGLQTKEQILERIGQTKTK